MKSAARVLTYFIDKVDKIEPVPSWMITALSVLSILICVFAIVGTSYTARAQSPVLVQQAINTQQIAGVTEKVNSLDGELRYQRDEIAILRDQGSTIRGIVVGVGSVLGFLQSIQVILQIKNASAAKKE